MSSRGSPTKAGGHNHAKKRRNRGSSDLEVETLRLGRYPFAGGIPYYVSTRSGRWRGRTTLPEEERKLHQLDKILRELSAAGLVKTMDPRHLDQEDITHFIRHLARYDPDVQRRHISRLNCYLKFFKNFVIEDMLAQGLLTMPRCAHKNVRTIGTDDLMEIFEAADRLQGWHGAVNRGMIAIYFGTGARPSELRLAEFKDLNMRRESLYVRHPKGEGSWASPEWVDIIRADVLPMIDRFLEERDEYVRASGLRQAVALFPNLYRGKDGFFSANCWRKIKQELVEEAGVDFRIKDFRSTLTTLTVNEDLSRLPAMSVQLRHASVGTTQKFYADINRAAAGKQLKNLCRGARPIVSKTPLIESQKEVTGYD